MKIKISYWILVSLLTVNCSQQREIIILSPDGKKKLTIIPGYERDGRKCPAFTLEAGNRKLLLPSCINLTTTGNLFESDFKVKNVARESVENQWTNNFGERKEVPDNYNQAKIFLENDEIKINLIYRAYNEGIAFAYEFPEQDGLDSVTIKDEKITSSFTSDHFAWSATRAQALYSRVMLSKIEKGCERPLVIEIDSNLVIALAEAKLVDYARMKFEPDSARNYNVITQLGGVVNCSLPFQSPWRVVMIGKDPGDLLEKNYLLLNLNDPCGIADVSWILIRNILQKSIPMIRQSTPGLTSGLTA